MSESGLLLGGFAEGTGTARVMAHSLRTDWNVGEHPDDLSTISDDLPAIPLRAATLARGALLRERARALQPAMAALVAD